MNYNFAMKLTLFLVVIGFTSVGLQAQVKPTSEPDYNGIFMYAVSVTNSAYPVIFKVETEEFIKGKLVKKSTEVVENESELHHRSTKTIVEGGKTRVVHEILIGQGNGFCKEGNGVWTRSKFVCESGLTVLFLPRKPESVKYSVEDKKLDGRGVKVYRKYSIFAPGTTDAQKTFEEEVATIDSDGYFISVIDTQGILESKEITRIQKQSWIIKAKMKPIVAPIK